jgi:alpha-beta hydrolase superfamily lysophospholipase
MAFADPENNFARVPSPTRQARRLPGWVSWILGLWLILLTIAVVLSLLALWPVAEAAQQSVLDAAAAKSATAPTYQSLHLSFVHIKLTADVTVLMVALLSGVLGSIVHALTRLTQSGNGKAATKDPPKRQEALWFIVNPIQGGLLALLIVIAVQAGLVTTGSAPATPVNLFTIAAVAGVSGLFSKRMATKLAAVIKNVAAAPPQPNPNGDPPPLDPGPPPTGPSGDPQAKSDGPETAPHIPTGGAGEPPKVVPHSGVRRTELKIEAPPAVPGMIVYVPGLSEKPEEIEPLLEILEEQPELEGFLPYVYGAPITPTSRGSLADRSKELATAISNFWHTQGQPDDVILMGHSIGGLMLRHAYLVGAGAFGDTPDEWVNHVSRIVLFAAPNRGFERRQISIPARWVVSLVVSLTHGWSAADALRGAPFLANLRIQWIKSIPKMETPPLVVQIRGTQDTAVLEHDSDDLEVMPNSMKFEVAGANHKNIVAPERVGEDRPGEQLSLLLKAIVGDLSNEADLAAKNPAPGKTVVFLIHGIRAGIFGWVGKLDERLTAADSTIVVEGASYGYLSAYKFMLPWGHDRQLRLFADWYTQMRSTHPDAEPHLVGHSNGTYIFGRSIQRIPAMTFNRVYLAGSVLPRNFAWDQHSGQVQQLINVCGRTDVPVGILCSALRGLGRKGLGVGGFTGFDVVPTPAQFVTIDGGHGAGLEDRRLPAVVKYIVKNTPPPRHPARPNSRWRVGSAKAWFGTLSRAAPAIAWVIVGVIVAILIVAGLWHLWAAIAGLGLIALLLLILSIA